MVVRLLGTTEIEGDRRVPLRGWRQAGLLVLLCAEIGRRVPTFRLEDELWQGRPVSDAAVRVTLKRLRDRFVEAGLGEPIVSEAGGCRLDLDPDEVDLWRFQRLVEEARTAWEHGHSAECGRTAGSALELWGGAPFAHLPELATAAIWAERAGRLRVDAVLLRAGAVLGAGDPIGALNALDDRGDLGEAARHREDVAGLRMLAAGLAGRRHVARHAYSELVQALHSDVGVAPGRDIEALREAIEQDDRAALDARCADFVPHPQPSGGRPGAVRHPTGGQRSTPAPLVGREGVLDEVGRAQAAGQVVLLRGAAGMGKTRLCEEMCDVTRAHGAVAVSAAVSELESGPESILLALRELEGDLGTAPLSSALAVDAGRVDVDLYRFRVHEAALEVLAAVPPGSLVVVDDLQWLDTGGTQLLWHLARRAVGVSWLFTARTSEPTGGTPPLIAAMQTERDLAVHEVLLGPMEDAELAELIRSRADTQLDDRTVVDTAKQCEGWPLLGVELAHHLADGGAPTEAPRSIAQRTAALLGIAGPHARAATELLAVAQVPLAPAAVGAAVGWHADDLGEKLSATGLVRVHDGLAEITHDLLRSAIVADLSQQRTAELHVLAAEALASGPPGHEAVVARHLLDADHLGRAALERSIGPALRALVRTGAYDDAAALAAEFLDAAGPEADTTDGLAGRVQVASVLLLTGRVETGLAVHDAVVGAIRHLGDPVLHADAVLARGPVDVGGAGARGLAEEAAGLLRRLPATAVSQRVQLCCWVAHHLLVAGQRATDTELRDTVEELVDEADVLTARADDPHLRGLVLGVAYQATTASWCTPRDGRRAMDRLRRWAAVAGAVSADAMVRLFDLDRAAVAGTVREHRAAVDQLEAIVPDFPRPDVRWYVEAGRAAELLAEGRWDDAVAQVERAAAMGDELHVAAAAEVQRLHQLLLMSGRGLLPALAPMLAEVTEADPSLQMALAGLVAATSGDAQRARWAAGVLERRAALLEHGGAAWPLLAHLAAELAFAAGHAGLGRYLTTALGHRAGTGLSMLGLVMLGSTDRVLGLGWAAAGDAARAREALQRAAAGDGAAGLSHWSAEAASHLGEMRDL